MDTVICDISALQYWRCPPIIRDAQIPLEQAIAPIGSGGAGVDAAVFNVRANAREADRLVRGRLLSDLKGLSLPVHVMTASSDRRAHDGVIALHRIAPLQASDVVPIGNGLSVLTPEATLLFLARSMNRTKLLLLMLEFLGTYSLLRETALARLTLTELLAQQVITRESQLASPDHIREFLDTRGRSVNMVGRSGKPLPWELSFDRFGRPTDLWRRPPLTCLDDLQRFAGASQGQRGSKAFLDAAMHAIAGSASPFESKWALLTCLDTRLGGEGWPMPALNQRVDFDTEARLISHQTYAICDQLWPESKMVIELDGEAYHADDMGFKRSSGRKAALEHLGYTVQEITYDQVSDISKYDVIVRIAAERLGLPLGKRTNAFRKRQRDLHRELFHTADL